jgi:hypothetical protein
MRLRAGAQQSVFSHQPLRLAHLEAGSIMEHLAIGGVGAQAPIPRQPALVAAHFDVGPGWVEGLITLDAPHFDASPSWIPVTAGQLSFRFCGVSVTDIFENRA